LRDSVANTLALDRFQVFRKAALECGLHGFCRSSLKTSARRIVFDRDPAWMALTMPMSSTSRKWGQPRLGNKCSGLRRPLCSTTSGTQNQYLGSGRYICGAHVVHGRAWTDAMR
jgi:hypothetical protein